MKRVCAIALVACLSPLTAFAGEGLAASGARHVQEIAATQPATTQSAPAGVAAKPVAAFQGQGGNLSRSSMSKGKKTLIFIGLAAIAVGGILTIDRNVLDVTPSTLGTRQD